MNSQERSAFVTGAGSGIGRATAQLLSARGFAVALFDIDEDSLRETEAFILEDGGLVRAFVGDVRSDADMERAVEATAAAFGTISTVAAIAGVAVQGSVLDLSVADWERTLAVNLTGVFLSARHTIPRLIESRGSFTAVSSDLGVTGDQGYVAYCASKHGVLGLIRCMALDHGPKGVRSNAVCPSFVDTPMAARIFASADASEMQSYRSGIPIGRFAKPEEIARVIAHLASDDAAYTNGMAYMVDGGATAGYFSASRAP